MTTTAMLDKTALRAECLRLFKDNKMESDERLAIIIADYFAPTLSHAAGDVSGVVTFLNEAATYFQKRDSKGEDLAVWSNVYNAENCRKAATTLLALSARAEAADARARELEADKAFTAEIASKAIKFKLGEIYVESRGPNAWVVSNGSSVRNSFGEWEWEPMPSNRDEDFISRTRLPFRDAWELARSVAKEAGNNG